MIAKAIKGKGFRGAVNYDLQKDGRRLLDTNMDGVTPRELAKEFGEIRKLRPKLGKAVLHVSLSAAPGEHLTDAQWVEIGRRYLHGMGLNDNQYLITRHEGIEHEHIHLLVNRIRFDGKVVSDSHDYRRHEVLMRAIERDYGLAPVRASADVERHAPTKGEIEEGLRTGIPSTRQRLQGLCDGAVKVSRNYSEYAEHLEAAGVELIPVTQLDGGKLSGLSYRLDGVMMKGSDLGKGYSPMGLAKRGISYEKDRDGEAVGRQRERAAAGRLGPADRSAAPGEAGERGAAGVDARADRAGDGGADRRDAPDLGHDRGEGTGTERTDQRADPGRGEGLPGGRGQGREVGGAHGAGREQPRTESLPDGAGDGLHDSAARERILALAGTADRAESSGRAGGSGVPAARDRSLEAVQRQIGAMGVDRFEVLVHDARSGRSEKRTWNKAEVLKSVPWLKRANAKGSDVYIAPAGEHGLVLVAGANQEELASLIKNSFAPAVVVETSRSEFDVWVKLSDKALSEVTRTVAQRGLVGAIGRDTTNHQPVSRGRMAGFTNQDAKQTRAGRQPYALVHAHGGAVAPSAKKYLDHIEMRFAEEQARLQRETMDLQRYKSGARSRGP